MLIDKSILKSIVYINIFLFLLIGCGGGGGSSSNSRTETFPMKQAFHDYYKKSITNEFSITGTVNGVSISGSGTQTSSAAVAGTFEGNSAYVVTESLEATVTGNGQSASMNYTNTTYLDSNYDLIGHEDNENYSIVTSAELPLTVKAGDSGDLGSEIYYSDNTKSTITETEEYTYSVIAKSSSKVTIEITGIRYDPSHVEIGSEVETYTLSNTGELSLIKVHAIMTDSDLNFEVE